jgi:hypothetical protein
VISECGLGIHHRANEPDGELRVGRQKQRTFAGTKLHHGLQGEIVVVEIFRKRSQTELRRTPLRSQRELFPNSGAEKGHLKFTTFEKGSGVSEVAAIMSRDCKLVQQVLWPQTSIGTLLADCVQN